MYWSCGGLRGLFYEMHSLSLLKPVDYMTHNVRQKFNEIFEHVTLVVVNVKQR